MPGSGNAAVLAPTFTGEEDRVNQAEHLDARVAKAIEGTAIFDRLFGGREVLSCRADSRRACIEGGL
jgi:hypothetical protein